MIRTPPRLPRPATPQRSFRTPPEPRITSPASGLVTSACCKAAYSSSARYCWTSDVNSVVSMNVSTLGSIRHRRSYVKDGLVRLRAHRCRRNGTYEVESYGSLVLSTGPGWQVVLSTGLDGRRSRSPAMSAGGHRFRRPVVSNGERLSEQNYRRLKPSRSDLNGRVLPSRSVMTWRSCLADWRFVPDANPGRNRRDTGPRGAQGRNRSAHSTRSCARLAL